MRCMQALQSSDPLQLQENRSRPGRKRLFVTPGSELEGIVVAAMIRLS